MSAVLDGLGLRSPLLQWEARAEVVAEVLTGHRHGVNWSK